MSIAVAIVDDARELLESLVTLIDQTSDMKCVAACPDAESALAQLPSLRPDVVLLDIELPAMSGIECVTRLKQLLPETHIMMLTIFGDSEQIFECLDRGATGYLLKEAEGEKLLESIRELHSGGSPMSPSIARKVVTRFQNQSSGPDLSCLSPRQREILDRLGRGRQYKEIADDFGISVHTVRTHIQKIYKLLQIHSKREAMNASNLTR